MNITEVISEFGSGIKKQRKEIFRDIIADNNIEKFMTSVPGVNGEYQMAMSKMSSILQGYQKAWTPKGELSFKANTLFTKRVKVDKEFEPDEIENEWLGYLFNEKLSRKDMPITKYLVKLMTEQAMIDKADIAVNGKFVALTPGTPGTTLGVADGTLENIKQAVIATTSNVITTGAMTTNPYTKVRSFIRSMSKKELRECGKTIFMSADIVDAVYDDYHDTNDNRELKSIGGDDYGYYIPGTDQVKIVAVEGMGASQRIWATPKWNWLKMFNLKEGLKGFDLQLVKRVLLLLGDFRLGYGFAFNEMLWHNDVE